MSTAENNSKPFDPILLDNDPDYSEREFDDGQIKRRFEKEWPELFDKVGELEDKIETDDIPECCAGHWVLFGCHRPHCTNGGINGNG